MIHNQNVPHPFARRSPVPRRSPPARRNDHEDWGPPRIVTRELPQAADEGTAARHDLLVALVIVLLGWTNLGLCQAPPDEHRDSESSRNSLLARREALMSQAQSLSQRGELSAAVEVAESVLAVEQQLFGPEDPLLADTTGWLIQTELARENFDGAKKHCQYLIRLAEKNHGLHTWHAVDARQRLAEIEQLDKLSPAARTRLAESATEMQQALTRFSDGEMSEAIRQFTAAVEKEAKALPEPSARHLQNLRQLAELCESAFQFGRAVDQLQKARTTLLSLYGPVHPDVLEVNSRLGRLYYTIGQYDGAEPVMHEAERVAKRLGGQFQREQMICLNNVASLYHAQGRYAEAQRLLREVLQQVQLRHGSETAEYATALNNLGGVYQELGDWQRAEQLLRKALSIRRRVLDASHPDTLYSLNNLAGLNLRAGKYEEARQQFAQVVQSQRATLGARHPDYANSVNNLAAAHEALGQLDEADRLFRIALSIREKTLGPNHPDVAASCHNLAALLRRQEHPRQAEAMLRRALAVQEQTIGQSHPDYAVSLNNLAAHFRRIGRFGESASWYRRALDTQRRYLDRTCIALSERQQLTLLRGLRRTLDGFLSVAPHAEIDEVDVYRYVLAWKGQVFLQQLAMRHASRNAEAGKLLERLRAVSGELAATILGFSEKTDSARRRRIADLDDKREQIETDLARLVGHTRDSIEMTPERLMAALPDDVVLVDLLEFWRSVPQDPQLDEQAAPQTELTAFIIRRNRPVARVALGGAESVGELIRTWRRTFGAAGKGAAAGRELRTRIWLPLEPHLDDRKTVLISPDGDMARLPLSALPGKNPGRFLLEERTLCTIPVPQLLPSILSQTPNRSPSESSLLLVGGIDYGTAVTLPDSPRFPTALRQFSRLPSSRVEILTVRDSFERASADSATVTTLRDSRASEQRFAAEAPRHRYLHLATHGYFAPPDWESPLSPAGDAQHAPAAHAATKSRLDANLLLHPGIFSGLAFSGANELAAGKGEDGILTALEVAAMDLKGVELAVLSACETGLGEVAAGEGVLGLQRAFQVAGTRTVVASLWKVDDRATQELMSRFYERLWSTDGPRSKIEALRSAQLAMLHDGRQRGMALVRDPNKQQADQQLVPPFYWAAFVLSGDWR